ncbi:MAG: sulfotransferase [Chloroflexi bacterium]|nr:sulfotransferase [Chloroflexota bacterium]
MTLLDKVRNRTARVRQHRWRMRPYRSAERHIVVGGSARSGTTLFRRILDTHPEICCGPEMNLFLPARFQLDPLATLSGIPPDELRSMFRSSPSQGALIDAFATRYRALREKSRWAEKTPLNVRHFGWVLERFPAARLVHMVRDGRDVICSAAQHPDRRWVDGRWVWELHRRPLEDYARTWVADTGAGMRFRGDARYHEVRYEDLVTSPEPTLRRLSEFLEVPFDPRLLESERAGSEQAAVPSPDRGPIFSSSIGRWRHDLDPAALARVLAICGDRLAELGYDS